MTFDELLLILLDVCYVLSQSLTPREIQTREVITDTSHISQCSQGLQVYLSGEHIVALV